FLGKIRALLPISIDVAIPVQSAAEAGFLECFDEHLEIRGGEKFPVRRIDEAIEDSTARRSENSRRRLPDVLGAEVRRILIKSAQRAAHVALQFFLGDARLLKIKDVMESAGRHRAHEIGRL